MERDRADDIESSPPCSLEDSQVAPMPSQLPSAAQPPSTSQPPVSKISKKSDSRITSRTHPSITKHELKRFDIFINSYSSGSEDNKKIAVLREKIAQVRSDQQDRKSSCSAFGSVAATLWWRHCARKRLALRRFKYIATINAYILGFNSPL